MRLGCSAQQEKQKQGEIGDKGPKMLLASFQLQIFYGVLQNSAIESILKFTILILDIRKKEIYADEGEEGWIRRHWCPSVLELRGCVLMY